MAEEKRKNVMPQKPDYGMELARIIRKCRGGEALREKLENYHENDIASVLEELSEEERQKLYSALDDERISEIFAYIEDDIDKYINELDPERAADIIETMDSADAADLLEELEEEKSDELKDLMEEEARQDIDLIQSYDEDTIGSRMTTNFVSIKKGYTIRQAMKALVEQAADNDNISTLYVTDDDGRFCGAIDLKDLIVARDYMELDSITASSYPYVYADEKTTDCIENLKDYSEDSIPVLDNENRIIGAITSQNIVEAVDEEMGEDYAKLAGLTAEEDLDEPFRESIKKRLPWLVLLLFLGLVVSTVVGMFETVVSQITLVVCFQSLILDMAGNAGTQSLAVTIRVLMDENISRKQERSLVLKEMKVGLCNGLILGLLSFFMAGFYIMIAKAKTPFFSFAVSGCIGVSLAAAMVISSAVGTYVPIFFKKIHVDPAVASGPLITTVNDLAAVAAYYGIVWILLINILSLVE
ncbi:MAG: magnesium transporter [Clostridia bacterium]|nr:magnesium transporter [Clostridia bacterium]